MAARAEWIELGEDALDVGAGGVRGHEQVPGDLGAPYAGGDAAQDLGLAGGERRIWGTVGVWWAWAAMGAVRWPQVGALR